MLLFTIGSNNLNSTISTQKVVANIIASTDNILKRPSEEFKQAQDSGMANTRILNSLDFHLLFAYRGSKNFIRTESNLAVWTASVPRNSAVTYTIRNGSARVDIVEEDYETNVIEMNDIENDIEASISLPTDVYDTALGGCCSSYICIPEVQQSP